MGSNAPANNHRFVRKLRSACRLIQAGPRAVAGALFRVERFVVYQANPERIPLPDAIPGARIEKLTVEDLNSLPQNRPEVVEQLEYIRRRGCLNAYAVRVDGQIAHSSWVMTPELERNYPIKNVLLRAGEVEITHCITLEEYRGRGLYPFAIRSICQIEAKRGTKRVFMITNVLNTASQRGMQKAGLTFSGKIIRLISPQFPESCSVTFRGHRWRRLR
jgi:RimJ/RimL family protein N-acetyltransferase